MPVSGSEPKSPGVSKIKEREHPMFSVHRQIQGGIFFYATFPFLFRLLLFVLYYNFTPFPLMFLLFLFYAQFLSPLFFPSMYRHPTLFQLHVFMPYFFKILLLVRCNFGSYCTIRFRIISSVIVSKCFIGFYPRPFILCSSYLQFLTQYLHS